MFLLRLSLKMGRTYNELIEALAPDELVMYRELERMDLEEEKKRNARARARAGGRR